MYISDFAIKRPMVTVVVMLALVIFGFFALQKLLVDEYPDVQQPVLLVGIPYPGASPSGVEREVLDPVEEAISGISGVDKVYGTAADSYAQVMVLFLFGKDMNVASQEIRDKISAIRADLPVEMKEPIIDHVDPSDLPIVSITVTSETLSPVTLTRLADKQIGRALRAIPGVAQVKLSGDAERELTVEVKPDALASTGISVADVVAALQTQNLAAPVGRLNGAAQEQTIRLEGRLKDPRAFEDIIIGTGIGGRPVRLSEVATVSDGAEEQRSLALYNGKEAIGIDVVKMRSASTTEVSDEIRTTLEQLKGSLPKDLDVQVIRDAGERVSASVWNVQEALIEGALLTVLVVFLFLNSWRSTVITGLALPVSVLASFIAVWAVGFTLNMMSLLGLSLAIGILIDDAIVVRENIVRHVHLGKSHMRAAHEGTSEIGLAVAATTFSIIAVFVPVAFMPGVAGQWFKPFALTIACSVLVSLFVSFSLDPMLSAYWPDPHVAEKDKGFITRLLDRFNHRFDQMSGVYRRLIGWSLDHPATVIVWVFASFLSALALASTGVYSALCIVTVAAVATVALRLVPARWYATVPTILVAVVAMGIMMGAAPKSKSVGSAFFGTDDRSEVNLTFQTAPGSSLGYTRDKLDRMLDIIRAHPEVRYTYATIGNATGGVDEGTIYARLVKPGERELGMEAFSQQLRGELQQVPGVVPALYTSGFGGQKQIQIQLRGDDPAALERGAEMVLAQVQQVEGAVDVGLDTRGQRPELKIDIDRDQAAAKGITAGQIALTLRPAFAGLDVGDWVDPDGETRDVMVRLGSAYRERPEDLKWLPLRTIGPSGPTMVPLWEVASVTKGLGPALIKHLDRDNVISVEANVSGRVLSEVMADINARIETLQLPAGVRITQGGDVEAQQKVFTDMFLALITGVLLMYLILVLQFGSFLDPLPIMMSLPLSLIGVMLALLVTGETINLMSLMGVILLMGIVAKNAILLIDFAKDARVKDGLPRRKALIEAGAIRLRPILMTTVALIAGMLPIAIGMGEGGQFRQPLGAAVIGGVITSTLLTLLVIPVAYEIVDEIRGGFLRFARRLAGSPARVADPELEEVGAAGDGATLPAPEPVVA